MAPKHARFGRSPLGEFRGARETGRFRWLAWEGEAPVGYLDCGTFDRWTTWETDDIAETVDVPSGGLALTVGPVPPSNGLWPRMLNALFQAPEVADIQLFRGGVDRRTCPVSPVSGRLDSVSRTRSPISRGWCTSSDGDDPSFRSGGKLAA